MRQPLFLLSLSLSSGCLGWIGGVIPDTGRLVTDDSYGVPDDTDAPVLPEWLGTGADGALELDGRLLLDSEVHGLSGREHPDAVRYVVESLDGASVTLSDEALGLAEGDEVLLLNMRGSSSHSSAVGAWEFLRIESVSGEGVVLASEPAVTFGEESNDDLVEQVVVLQRVPNYSTLRLAEGAELTVSGWDRSGGGVLALRASEGVIVEAGAAVDLSVKGYEGGDYGSASYDGYQGESYLGRGIGGGGSSSYNEGNGGYAPNAGGGGANITGGGASHGGYGTPGDAWNTGYTAPQAGETYGEVDLSRLFLGSGAGGIWNGSDGTEGPGGSGGGIVFVAAATLEVQEGGAIRSTGGTTTGLSEGSYTYGAGGGSGGSLWLVADELSLAEGTVDAVGGEGQHSCQREGGDGGVGRVRIDCQVCNGAQQGSADASSALVLASEPDPEWSEAPE